MAKASVCLLDCELVRGDMGCCDCVRAGLNVCVCPWACLFYCVLISAVLALLLLSLLIWRNVACVVLTPLRTSAVQGVYSELLILVHTAVIKKMQKKNEMDDDF